MKATAKQVAHLAGVSLSAVSRAFTPGAPLKDETRKRILAAAGAIGYINPGRRTADAIAGGTITLVAGDLSNPFYPMVLESLAVRLQDSERQLVVHALPAEADIDVVIPRIVVARPSGVIVTSAHLTSKMAIACREQGIKVVLMNRTQPDLRIHSVACDNHAGGRDVAHYLLERGRRKIGFIGGVPNTSTHVDRLRGFRERLAEQGHAIHCEASGMYDYRQAYAAAIELLSREDRPDALFCCNDIMGIAAVDAAREKGLSLPDDIAIVGFDGIAMAAWPTYRLTTVRQPVDRMIQEALSLIDEDAAGPFHQGITRIVRGKLVIRSSA